MKDSSKDYHRQFLLEPTVAQIQRLVVIKRKDVGALLRLSHVRALASPCQG